MDCNLRGPVRGRLDHGRIGDPVVTSQYDWQYLASPFLAWRRDRRSDLGLIVRGAVSGRSVGMILILQSC